jgi:hypothetical protein
MNQDLTCDDQRIDAEMGRVFQSLPRVFMRKNEFSAMMLIEKIMNTISWGIKWENGQEKSANMVKTLSQNFSN